MKPKPLRIVFCLNGPSAVNGPNVWMTRHLPLLKARGFDVRVLYVSWHPKMQCRFRNQLEREGVHCRSVELGRFTEINAEKIAKAVWAMKPDVFVPNYSVAGYFACRFLREAGVKTVGTLHSDDPYYHDLVDFFITGQPKWKLSGVVSVSNFLTDVVKKTRMPVLHSPYGCPTPKRFARWKPDSFEMVYCGRLEERQKQVSKVADAFVATASDKVSGVFYGDGVSRKRVDAIIEPTNGLVRCEGAIKSHQVAYRMSKGQAFVLLSKFEGFSIALMEAMSMGLVPIVSPMRSGLSDIIENGKNAFVVRASDKKLFAKRIDQLATDKALWERMSAAARASIVDNGYTSEACADQWAGFIDRLCKGKDRGRLQKLNFPINFNEQMPERSERPDGINVEDHRLPIPLVKKRLREGRRVYLWGASLGGRLFLRQMKKHNLPTASFLDSSPKKDKMLGLPIYQAHQKLKELRKAGENPFVVISSFYEDEIAKDLSKIGLGHRDDYIAG